MSATGRSMSMSEFMDKQIMDLSKSNLNEDVIDLVDPHESTTNKEEIDPTSNFESIRPTGIELDRDDHINTGVRVWKSADSIAEVSGIAIKNYDSLGSTGPSKFTTEKDRIDHNAVLTSEIEGIMRIHTESLMNALNGLSARLSQFESRSRHLENSVDDLKLSIGNNHGIADGRLRQIENVLREVQSSVQDIKDKQDVTDAHIQLSIMQISKTGQQSQSETAAASAPESNLPHLPPAAIPQAPPSFQTVNASLSGHLIPPGQISSVPQGDPYFLPQPVQIQDATVPQYQQHLQPPPMLIAPPQQQYQQPQETAPYPPPPQTYQSSLLQQHQQQQQPPPTKLPSGAPFQQFYGAPYDHHSPSSRLGSGFPPTSYEQASPGNGDAYPPPYRGSPQYGADFSKQQQSSVPPPSQGGGGYNQLPSARILPKALPTASPVGGGGDGSSSGGGGNRVPVDDVVDKVTTMGFPRDQVRAIVRKLTENGQSVDLNTVLDKLMNDGEGGWYGRR
ncbi:protein tfg-1 [Impatiens glandulifera]|uniref:protein tfg-1 n=1 Tax=Impatiens glandulifera TaxID=253017 RepID=UPI001FB0CD8A|nr:protein tfg-1 [Impatiens glandulifera]